MIAAIVGPFSKAHKIDSALQFFHMKDKIPYKLSYKVVA